MKNCIHIWTTRGVRDGAVFIRFADGGRWRRGGDGARAEFAAVYGCGEGNEVGAYQTDRRMFEHFREGGGLRLRLFRSFIDSLLHIAQLCPH